MNKQAERAMEELGKAAGCQEYPVTGSLLLALASALVYGLLAISNSIDCLGDSFSSWRKEG